MQSRTRITSWLLAVVLLLALTGCAQENEVQTGVYKGQEQWSFGNEGAEDKKIEVELESGEKVMVDMPEERPEPNSTLKVQKQSDGSWEVVQ